MVIVIVLLPLACHVRDQISIFCCEPSHFYDLLIFYHILHPLCAHAYPETLLILLTKDVSPTANLTKRIPNLITDSTGANHTLSAQDLRFISASNLPTNDHTDVVSLLHNCLLGIYCTNRKYISF